ncbi:MAG: hypothetical protein NUV80_02795 [Candidatus Berkelbacteria bacterium]|nr:hypothetical protein [Candidatus Berkelbacteria bacterium]
MRKTFTYTDYLVVAMMVVMVVVVFPDFFKARENRQTKTCIANLRQIKDAKLQWGKDALEGKSRVWIPIFEATNLEEKDLAPKYLSKMPECPSDGVYTIGTPSHPPKCSIHGPLKN